MLPGPGHGGRAALCPRSRAGQSALAHDRHDLLGEDVDTTTWPSRHEVEPFRAPISNLVWMLSALIQTDCRKNTTI
ncbi:hypothetical protein ACVWWI_006719 [Bradyrhizobium sp. USDA 3686]|uniref:hypothetical protein n=1 Tax=Bradyrhizobium TaxID=374 RepID=UPI00195B061D|nr:hypothetical protein [Bradyrhizobium canariense]MBM7487725.1 hypothetical protein [Bradyrhizobium canariense]UFW71469.1 hypothetical protein BcanWU425_33430 [Bradyrhizobium canariense]